MAPNQFVHVPPGICHVEHLDNLLSEPGPAVIEVFSRIDGDVIILGAGGKIGPSLARMVKRAAEIAGKRRRILAVSRFSSADIETSLRAHGIDTVRCDLLDPGQLHALPGAANVIYLAGMKFGSAEQPGLTWMINTYLPGMVSNKYRDSKIVAFSTGNVYGLSPVYLGGSVETDQPRPVGEYAMSCLGRERIFEHFSRTLAIPLALVRLNYATELRYGVLVDLALRVRDGKPIDLSMGHFNTIWQGDANAMALQALEHVCSPPFVVNIAGAELLSVRRVSQQLGQLMEKEADFQGVEAPDAFLSNGQLGHRLFGYPHVSVQQMIHWIAEWVQRGGECLNKPAHFEVRDGNF